MNLKILNGIKPFLFENLSIKQTILKNTFWLTAANFVSKVLRFVLFIYVARLLGATEYGKFTFAMSFVGVFVMFADFGLSQIITRNFAQDKEREKEFPSILSLKVFLTFTVLLLISVGSLFITPDPVIKRIILILAISGLAENFIEIIYAFFRARQKMEYLAFIIILETLITFGMGMFILFYMPSVSNFSYSYVTASLVGLLAVLLILNFKFQKLSLRIDKSVWKKFLLVSWPLALIGVLNSIYNQTDSVMLGYFKQITQTGWYNAAYRIIAITLIPIGLITVSIFPVLSKSFAETKERMHKIWDFYMESVIFLAIPLVVGGMVLATRIISIIYGQGYYPAVLAFQILLLTSGIIFLYTPLQQALIVFNQQKKIFWIALFSAIFNIILNAIFIQKYSLYGAAGATVATHFVIGILFFILMKNFNFISPVDKKTLINFIISVISSLVMYFTISMPVVYEFNIIIVLILGVVIYSAVYLLLRKIIKNLSHANEEA
jgi:O-antigen/teichoic acid export membrane protein